MTSVVVLKEERLSAPRLTAAGRPRRTRPLPFEFEAWLYLGFPKTNQMAFGLGGGHRIFQRGAF